MIPLRSLHFVPATPVCLSPNCLDRVLNEPLFLRLPVYDDAGTMYAFDVAPTQGLVFLTIMSIVVSELLPVLKAKLKDLLEKMNGRS